MSLIVIRHGRSEWNQDNKFTGKTDVSLSDKGIKEAEECGNILLDIDFKYVFVSSLKRTHQTYHYIKSIKDLYNIDKTIKESYYVSEKLDERDYGDLTGKNKTELKEEYGEDKVHIWRRSYNIAPPGGETLEEVKIRVGKYFDEFILEKIQKNENVLIVSHGNTLRALFVHLGIISSELIENFEVPTGTPIQINIMDKSYSYVNRYELDAYQILDSRGNPTIEVKCYNKITGKVVGKGSCPSGASCGSNEMHELRDLNKICYQGKSVFGAVLNIKEANKKLILNNLTVCDLKKMDTQIFNLDNSELKTNFGGNAITAMSFCMADVASNLSQIEMYDYINRYNKSNRNNDYLPTPLVNIINGGKHGITGELKIQEFMIFPLHNIPVKIKVQQVTEVYYTLRKILADKYGKSAIAIGDEGGFCPPITSPSEALDIIQEAIVVAGYIPGKNIFIALDCAASEYYDETNNTYEIEPNIHLNRDELSTYYGNLIEKYPALKSIEDAFHEADYLAWKHFTKMYGNKIMIVGDDLFTSNKKYIQKGLDEQWANALLLKVNQVGTVTDAIDGANMMFEQGNEVIVSHRSGETNHAYLIDIAIGIGAKYVKIGSPCRGERVAKFNRLLEVEAYRNKNLKTY